MQSFSPWRYLDAILCTLRITRKKKKEFKKFIWPLDLIIKEKYKIAFGLNQNG